jgi:hypothetical protein
MASLSVLGVLALYTYSEKTVVAIQTSSPELYDFVLGYKTTVEVAFIIFMVLFFIWNIVAHHWKSLDNGIIDDPDQKRWDDRKMAEDAYRDVQIEELKRDQKLDLELRKKEAEQKEKEKEQKEKEWQEMRQKILELYERGNRFEKNPQPPEGENGEKEERRKLVRSDPSVPLSEEEIEKILPPVFVEEPLPLENVSEPEEETETKKNSDYYGDSKLDQAVIGGIKKVFTKK